MRRPPRRYDENRLLVRDGWRHYRPTYSLAEVRWGLLTLAALVAVSGWVAYRGAHPDAEVVAMMRGADGDGGEATSRAGEGGVAEGPWPDGLEDGGWAPGAMSAYDPDDLYVKINGRADYYRSYGCQRLYALTLTHLSEGRPAATIDLELYDLGSAANALGAYAGERSPESTPRVGPSGMSHIARNALFLIRGRYYLRAIGSDESEAIREKLASLREEFGSLTVSSALPWAYSLFVGQMGVAPEHVSYLLENAFSFGFAKDVYVARPEGSQRELFVAARGGEKEARALAAAFAEGFASLGEAQAPDAEAGGVRWVRDRYLGSLSGAVAEGRWVAGVRRAETIAQARKALRAVLRAVTSMPEALRQRAVPAAPAPSGNEGTADGGNAARPDVGEIDVVEE